MPALMAKRASSERCAIRRELHRRRKLAAAPKGGIVKKSASIQKKPSADEPAGPATTMPSSMTMPMPRPPAGVATSPASILQHAPAAVATKDKKQPAVVAKGDGAAAKEIASVPLGQIAKRCTAPPRRSALIPAASKMKVSAVIKRVSGVPNKSASPCPSDSSGAETTELPATAGAAYIKNMPTIPARSRSSSVRVKKGMTVKVRTRAGMLPTGHCLVLWLAARVVSDAAADDGFLDVIYNGNFPRDDPSRTVRVAMDDVRSMPAIVES